MDDDERTPKIWQTKFEKFWMTMNGAKRSERRIFMFEKLEAVEKRYEELTKMISDPEVISNQSEWQKLMKEHASIEDIVLKF